VRIGKQALIFLNTKQRAEKTAEEISKHLIVEEQNKKKLDALSEEVLSALESPTEQCKRLASCIKTGIAFHHSGLVQKQRELIEENFRNGTIKIICCTPTLAYGLDLPAFRVVVRDLKRFGARGMELIPVLEVQQMFGRAGRPSYDSEGEALCIAENETQEEMIREKYFTAEPEPIYSKLAVEPVLRTYLLSLISSGIVSNLQEIISFFNKTFWAHQFRDTKTFQKIIKNTLEELEEWEFISSGEKEKKGEEFLSAYEIKNMNAHTERNVFSTRIGQRVSQLYIDPLTAHQMIQCLKRAERKEHDTFAYLQMISNTLEMKPLLNVKNKELEEIYDFLLEHEQLLLVVPPKEYEVEYDDFIRSVKTAMLFNDWIEEKSEDYLMEKYGIRPGEFSVKRGNADWLLYSCEELCKILSLRECESELRRLRIRMEYGAKEELVPLLRLKGIGRIKARILYNNRIRDLGDVKKTPMAALTSILGKTLAISIKAQVGESPKEEAENSGTLLNGSWHPLSEE
ncbi:MAG: helicase-related protein, partial [Candidatus Woesearchaeota archaeon]